MKGDLWRGLAHLESSMTETSSDLRFLAEPPIGSSWTGEAKGHVEISIPHGVSIFAAQSDAAPRLEAAAGTTATQGIVFETLRAGARDVLLMHTPPGLSARVNGQPAPRVLMLEIRDQLQIGDELLHVTRFRRLRATPPGDELIGRVCGVCRLKIHANTRVIVHDCGAPLHLEPDTVPEHERLECARIGCPNCREPVEFSEGFVYEPEAMP